MASKDEHLQKARHNENFFNLFEVDSTPYRDWVITAIFYSAIHYIRALFAKHGFANVSRYGHMDNLFSTLSVFRRNRGVYSDYRTLKDDSREARYEMRVFPRQEVRALKDDEFQRIKAFVLSKL